MFRGFVQSITGLGILFGISMLAVTVWIHYRDNPEDFLQFEQKLQRQEPKRDLVLAAIQPKPPRVELNHAQRLQHVAELSWKMLQARELFEQFTDPYAEIRTATPIPPWEFDNSRVGHQIRRAMLRRPESEKLSTVANLVTKDLERHYREIKRLQSSSDLAFDSLEIRLSRLEDVLDAVEDDFRFYEAVLEWIAAEHAGTPAPAIPPQHHKRLRVLLAASLSASELEQIERIHTHDAQLEQFYRSAEAWQVFGEFALDATERTALERAKSNPEYDVSAELLNVPQAQALEAETFGPDAFLRFVRDVAGDESADRVESAFQCCSKPPSVPASLQSAWQAFALHAGPAAFLSRDDLYFLELKFLEHPRANRRYRGRGDMQPQWKKKNYWPFAE